MKFRIIYNSHPAGRIIGFSKKLFLQLFERRSPFRQRRSRNLSYFINGTQNASFQIYTFYIQALTKLKSFFFAFSHHGIFY